MLQHTLKDLRDKVDVMHFDALAKKYRMSRAFNEKDQSFGARFRHILPVPRSARQLPALPQLSFLTPRLGH